MRKTERQVLTEDDELDLEHARQQMDVEHEYIHITNTQHTPAVTTPQLDQETAVVSENPKEANAYISAIKRHVVEPLGSIIYPDGQDSYMPWSIINTLFCGVFLGLVALLFSIFAYRLNKQEKRRQAKRFSYLAYLMNIIATLAGTTVYLTLYILYCTSDSMNLSPSSKIKWYESAQQG